MENNCGIMGLKEDEMELELGLSIGGIFGKGEKLKPVKNGSKNNEIPVEDCRESVDFDPKMHRKIQALRRHEAKKKREEKQQKRWRCQQNGEFRRKENDDDDVTEERDCKKNKVEEFSGDVKVYLNAELNHPSAYPVFPVRVPYPYPHLQFVPVANGFPYSCVNSMPSWGYGAGNVQVAVQPVAMNGGLHVQPGHRNERIRESGSNGSSPYSSSIFSDLQSSSNQGGHRDRDEPVTNTSPSQQEHPQTNNRTPSHQMGQSDQSCTSHQMDSAQSNAKSSQSGIEKTPSMNVAESTSYPKKAQLKPESQSSTKDVDKGEIGKPPKPRTPPIHDILRHMPCVSTTGNGPDGKTINGFLYRYTKSEVSIICVCHGNSFTPAEFVEHAGGNDVSHPLRHISVIPSAIQEM